MIWSGATAPPLDPDAAEARRQLLQELSKPEYQRSKSNLAQIIVNAISDWLASLRIPTGFAGLSPLGLVIIIAIVLAVLLLAFFVFGLPRLNRRTTTGGTLFGDDDVRDAAALRAAAEAAAAEGDFTTAIAEGFRAIARGLSERGILTTFPGTTASGFAWEASTQFPDLAGELEQAARSFDSVRYLGGTGDAAGWQSVRALDGALRTAKPRREPVTA